MDFKQAREFMAEELRSDEGLRYAYEANVAMLLSDRFNRAEFSDPSVRTKAARDLLYLIFDS